MSIVVEEPPDDAELAVAAAGGDSVAFSAIYDRYADRLHDFCAGMLRDPDAAADCVQDVFVIAATKLTTLDDTHRLRGWLYAVARREVLARVRFRRRELPSDELPENVSADPDPSTVAARHELADLIDQAFGGLSDRDRTVYQLAYRHGLTGPELAEALGVTQTAANTMVGRLRTGIERSLGALLVCRSVAADPAACPELAELINDWDGALTPLMRKRVVRHIDGCDACDAERRRRVHPAALLGAPVLFSAPEWLREDTLRKALAAPADSAPSKRVIRAGLAAGLLLLGLGGVVQLMATPTAPMQPASPPVAPASAPVVPASASLRVTVVETAAPSSDRGVMTARSLPPSVPATSVAPSPPVVATSEVVSTAPPRTRTTRTVDPSNSFTPTTRRPVTRTRAPTTAERTTERMTATYLPGTPVTVTTSSEPIE